MFGAMKLTILLMVTFMYASATPINSDYVDDSNDDGKPPCSSDAEEDYEETIYYPHPRSCSHYYECFQGVLTVSQCMKGLHFNPQAIECDFPENANCVLKSWQEEKLTTKSRLQPNYFLLNDHKVNEERLNTTTQYTKQINKVIVKTTQVEELTNKVTTNNRNSNIILHASTNASLPTLSRTTAQTTLSLPVSSDKAKTKTFLEKFFYKDKITTEKNYVQLKENDVTLKAELTNDKMPNYFKEKNIGSLSEPEKKKTTVAFRTTETPPTSPKSVTKDINLSRISLKEEISDGKIQMLFNENIERREDNHLEKSNSIMTTIKTYGKTTPTFSDNSLIPITRTKKDPYSTFIPKSEYPTSDEVTTEGAFSSNSMFDKTLLATTQKLFKSEFPSKPLQAENEKTTESESFTNEPVTLDNNSRNLKASSNLKTTEFTIYANQFENKKNKNMGNLPNGSSLGFFEQISKSIGNEKVDYDFNTSKNSTNINTVPPKSINSDTSEFFSTRPTLNIKELNSSASMEILKNFLLVPSTPKVELNSSRTNTVNPNFYTTKPISENDFPTTFQTSTIPEKQEYNLNDKKIESLLPTMENVSLSETYTDREIIKIKSTSLISTSFAKNQSSISDNYTTTSANLENIQKNDFFVTDKTLNSSTSSVMKIISQLEEIVENFDQGTTSNLLTKVPLPQNDFEPIQDTEGESKSHVGTLQSDNGNVNNIIFDTITDSNPLTRGYSIKPSISNHLIDSDNEKHSNTMAFIIPITTTETNKMHYNYLETALEQPPTKGLLPTLSSSEKSEKNQNLHNLLKASLKSTASTIGQSHYFSITQEPTSSPSYFKIYENSDESKSTAGKISIDSPIMQLETATSLDSLTYLVTIVEPITAPLPVTNLEAPHESKATAARRLEQSSILPLITKTSSEQKANLLNSQEPITTQLPYTISETSDQLKSTESKSLEQLLTISLQTKTSTDQMTHTTSQEAITAHLPSTISESESTKDQSIDHSLIIPPRTVTSSEQMTSEGPTTAQLPSYQSKSTEGKSLDHSSIFPIQTATSTVNPRHLLTSEEPITAYLPYTISETPDELKSTKDQSGGHSSKITMQTATNAEQITYTFTSEKPNTTQLPYTISETFDQFRSTEGKSLEQSSTISLEAGTSTEQITQITLTSQEPITDHLPYTVSKAHDESKSRKDQNLDHSSIIPPQTVTNTEQMTSEELTTTQLPYIILETSGQSKSTEGKSLEHSSIFSLQAATSTAKSMYLLTSEEPITTQLPSTISETFDESKSTKDQILEHSSIIQFQTARSTENFTYLLTFEEPISTQLPYTISGIHDASKSTKDQSLEYLPTVSVHSKTSTEQLTHITLEEPSTVSTPFDSNNYKQQKIEFLPTIPLNSALLNSEATTEEPDIVSLPFSTTSDNLSQSTRNFKYMATTPQNFTQSIPETTTEPHTSVKRIADSLPRNTEPATVVMPFETIEILGVPKENEIKEFEYLSTTSLNVESDKGTDQLTSTESSHIPQTTKSAVEYHSSNYRKITDFPTTEKLITVKPPETTSELYTDNSTEYGKLISSHFTEITTEEVKTTESSNIEYKSNTAATFNMESNSSTADTKNHFVETNLENHKIVSNGTTLTHVTQPSELQSITETTTTSLEIENINTLNAYYTETSQKISYTSMTPENFDRSLGPAKIKTTNTPFAESYNFVLTEPSKPTTELGDWSEADEATPHLYVYKTTVQTPTFPESFDFSSVSSHVQKNNDWVQTTKMTIPETTALHDNLLKDSVITTSALITDVSGVTVSTSESCDSPDKAEIYNKITSETPTFFTKETITVPLTYTIKKIEDEETSTKFYLSTTDASSDSFVSEIPQLQPKKTTLVSLGGVPEQTPHSLVAIDSITLFEEPNYTESTTPTHTSKGTILKYTEGYPIIYYDEVEVKTKYIPTESTVGIDQFHPSHQIFTSLTSIIDSNKPQTESTVFANKEDYEEFHSSVENKFDELESTTLHLLATIRSDSNVPSLLAKEDILPTNDAITEFNKLAHIVTKTTEFKTEIGNDINIYVRPTTTATELILTSNETIANLNERVSTVTESQSSISLAPALESTAPTVSPLNPIHNELRSTLMMATTDGIQFHEKEEILTSIGPLQNLITIVSESANEGKKLNRFESTTDFPLLTATTTTEENDFKFQEKTTPERPKYHSKESALTTYSSTDFFSLMPTLTVAIDASTSNYAPPSVTQSTTPEGEAFLSTELKITSYAPATLISEQVFTVTESTDFLSKVGKEPTFYETVTEFNSATYNVNNNIPTIFSDNSTTTHSPIAKLNELTSSVAELNDSLNNLVGVLFINESTTESLFLTTDSMTNLNEKSTLSLYLPKTKFSDIESTSAKLTDSVIETSTLKNVSNNISQLHKPSEIESKLPILVDTELSLTSYAHIAESVTESTDPPNKLEETIINDITSKSSVISDKVNPDSSRIPNEDTSKFNSPQTESTIVSTEADSTVFSHQIGKEPIIIEGATELTSPSKTTSDLTTFLGNELNTTTLLLKPTEFPVGESISTSKKLGEELIINNTSTESTVFSNTSNQYSATHTTSTSYSPNEKLTEIASSAGGDLSPLTTFAYTVSKKIEKQQIITENNTESPIPSQNTTDLTTILNEGSLSITKPTASIDQMSDNPIIIERTSELLLFKYKTTTDLNTVMDQELIPSTKSNGMMYTVAESTDSSNVNGEESLGIQNRTEFFLLSDNTSPDLTTLLNGESISSVHTPNSKLDVIATTVAESDLLKQIEEGPIIQESTTESSTIINNTTSGIIPLPSEVSTSISYGTLNELTELEYPTVHEETTRFNFLNNKIASNTESTKLTFHVPELTDPSNQIGIPPTLSETGLDDFLYKDSTLFYTITESLAASTVLEPNDFPNSVHEKSNVIESTTQLASTVTKLSSTLNGFRNDPHYPYSTMGLYKLTTNSPSDLPTDLIEDTLLTSNAPTTESVEPTKSFDVTKSVYHEPKRYSSEALENEMLHELPYTASHMTFTSEFGTLVSSKASTQVTVTHTEPTPKIKTDASSSIEENQVKPILSPKNIKIDIKYISDNNETKHQQTNDIENSESKELFNVLPNRVAEKNNVKENDTYKIQSINTGSQLAQDGETRSNSSVLTGSNNFEIPRTHTKGRVALKTTSKNITINEPPTSLMSNNIEPLSFTIHKHQKNNSDGNSEVNGKTSVNATIVELNSRRPLKRKPKLKTTANTLLLIPIETIKNSSTDSEVKNNSTVEEFQKVTTPPPTSLFHTTIITQPNKKVQNNVSYNINLTDEFQSSTTSIFIPSKSSILTTLIPNFTVESEKPTITQTTKAPMNLETPLGTTVSLIQFPESVRPEENKNFELENHTKNYTIKPNISEPTQNRTFKNGTEIRRQPNSHSKILSKSNTSLRAKSKKISTTATSRKSSRLEEGLKIINEPEKINVENSTVDAAIENDAF